MTRANIIERAAQLLHGDGNGSCSCPSRNGWAHLGDEYRAWDRTTAAFALDAIRAIAAESDDAAHAVAEAVGVGGGLQPYALRACIVATKETP